MSPRRCVRWAEGDRIRRSGRAPSPSADRRRGPTPGDRFRRNTGLRPATALATNEASGSGSTTLVPDECNRPGTERRLAGRCGACCATICDLAVAVDDFTEVPPTSSNSSTAERALIVRKRSFTDARQRFRLRADRLQQPWTQPGSWIFTTAPVMQCHRSRSTSRARATSATGRTPRACLPSSLTRSTPVCAPDRRPARLHRGQQRRDRAAAAGRQPCVRHDALRAYWFLSARALWGRVDNRDRSPQAPPAARAGRRCHSTVVLHGFYATLAWLPSIFRSHGASEAHAGLLLSLTMVVGLIRAVTVPGWRGGAGTSGCSSSPAAC